MGIWPVHWGELIGFTVLILALFNSWGTLLGTWLKRRTPLATLAIGLCVPLFFLSGPFGPISFFAPIEQLVARAFPVYYAIVVLQHAFHDFTLNTSGIGINLLDPGRLCAWGSGPGNLCRAAQYPGTLGERRKRA